MSAHPERLALHPFGEALRDRRGRPRRPASRPAGRWRPTGVLSSWLMLATKSRRTASRRRRSEMSSITASTAGAAVPGGDGGDVDHAGPVGADRRARASRRSGTALERRRSTSSSMAASTSASPWRAPAKLGRGLRCDHRPRGVDDRHALGQAVERVLERPRIERSASAPVSASATARPSAAIPLWRSATVRRRQPGPVEGIVDQRRGPMTLDGATPPRRRPPPPPRGARPRRRPSTAIAAATTVTGRPRAQQPTESASPISRPAGRRAPRRGRSGVLGQPAGDHVRGPARRC